MPAVENEISRRVLLLQNFPFCVTFRTCAETSQKAISMNLDDMTLEELKQLRKDLVKAIETYEARQLAEARAKLEEYAKEMGVKLEDVMGLGKSKGKLKGLPKYCHPNDPSLTWTGKGRKPAWLTKELDAGMSLERFKI